MIRRTGIRAGLLGAVASVIAAPEAAAAPTVGSLRVDSVVVLGWVVILGVVGALLVGRYAPQFVVTLESFAGGVAEEARESDPAVERPRDSADARTDASPPSTDEERVLELLEENGGRLPQGEIVCRTPWSKSKVSRLLARMDVQDRIVKIRAGRENIIVLPGEEPAAVQPPRDRESEQD